MSAVNSINSAAEKRTNMLSACLTWRQKISTLSRGSVLSRTKACKPTRNYTLLQHALLLGCSIQALTAAVCQDGCLSTKIQKEYRSFLLSVTSVILLLRT